MILFKESYRNPHHPRIHRLHAPITPSHTPDTTTLPRPCLAAHNNNPRPLVWTATAESILTKVARGRVTLNRETKSGTHH